MTAIPTDPWISAAFGLFGEGFKFIENRRKKYNSDIFKISLPGLKVICFGGEDAARAFYDPDKFVRKGAVPPPVQKTLTGENAIHTTDGQVHHNRKEMFMSLMTPENIDRLTGIVHHELIHALKRWERKNAVSLFAESAEILCRSICTWAGVPLEEREIALRAKDFIAMIDAFGAVGPRNWRGMQARKRTEKWIEGVINDVRINRIAPKEGSALFITSHHRDTSGQLFDQHLAAVELINILRPTVAISWYVAFGATALHTYPECRQRFTENKGNYQEAFINEVRRFYPFAPFMGARVKKDFTWHDYQLKEGSLVLLDMYGTNHDARLWPDPERFNPDRFKERTIGPFDFLAQGGGDPYEGHRCPGEWITIEVLKTFLSFLLKQTGFTVPKQDLSYNLKRMPTLPQSGFVIENVVHYKRKSLGKTVAP